MTTLEGPKLSRGEHVSFVMGKESLAQTTFV